jgi:predicted DNA-binding transcriptional regulator YafY
MRKATETVNRLLDLLDCIPRQPGEISTTALKNKLLDRGHDVNVRTIQRDLDSLSGKFPLVDSQKGRKKYWSFLQSHAGLEVPGMSNATAITMLLVREYLLAILPTTVLDQLKPYFDRAGSVLQGTRFEHWEQKAALIQRGPELTPSPIDSAVRETVFQALLDENQFEIDYLSRGESTAKQYRISPLGLVVRQGVFYLIGTLWEYTDVRQFALHRMTKPKLLDQPVEPNRDFSLQRYIKDESGFAYRRSETSIKLVVLFDASTGEQFSEWQLAKDQQTKIEPDGRLRLEATVPDTEELRWWLLGFGECVEVLEPASLRDEFWQTIERMRSMYKMQV